jgi:AmmeMemoRadiSam system protein B
MQLFAEYIMEYYTETQFYYTKKTYQKPTAILIPYMHHLYTGTLQALGYRLLDATKQNTTFIILLPGEHEDEICAVPQADTITHILGKKIQIHKSMQTKITQGKTIQRKESDEIFASHGFLFSQIAFLRMYIPNFSVIPIVVNTKVDAEKLVAHCNKYITEENVQYIIYTNIDITPTEKSIENLYKEIVTTAINEKLIPASKNHNKTLLKTFIKLAQSQKKKIKDHRYTDNSDFHKEKIKTIYSVRSF